MSNIEALLTRTRAAAAKREQATRDEYRELVGSAARGGDLDVDTLADWLSRSGFSAEQFAADVQHCAARRSAAAALAAKPGAEHKLATATAALTDLIASHEQKVAAARARFDAEVAKLTRELETATAPHLTDKVAAEKAISDAEDAEAHLIKTAPDELKAEVTAVREQIATAEANIEKLSAKLKQSETFARDSREALIADAEERGARTFRDETSRGGSAEDAKYRATRNAERFVKEDLAKVERHLQDQRDAIESERRVVASWHAQIERIEQRMLIA